MKKTFWAGLLCLSSSFAGAGDFAKTPQEESMCQAMIYNGRDTSDRENWQHMHHYCDCLRFTNRAYSSLGNWYEVKYNLKLGIGGCDYVLSHTKPDFYMRPEVHLQKGKALRLYRQEGQAIIEFMEAIKNNPTLAQAYVELADIQSLNKKSPEALKTVIEGLRHAPDSKPLKRRYTEFGGKLPYPEPVAKKPVSTPVTDAEGVSKPNSSGLQVSPAPVTAMPQEANVPVKTGDKPDEPAVSPADTPKIGSPTNPWCRFCPDPVVKP